MSLFRFEYSIAEMIGLNYHTPQFLTSSELITIKKDLDIICDGFKNKVMQGIP
jgi:hypothetical protein